MSIRNFSQKFVKNGEILYFGDIDAKAVNCKSIKINGVQLDINSITTLINTMDNKVNTLESIVNNNNLIIASLRNDNIKLKNVISELVGINI